jgi:hypothetical protein
MYNQSCAFWTLLARVFREAEAGCGLSAKSKARFRWAQFWGAVRPRSAESHAV